MATDMTTERKLSNEAKGLRHATRDTSAPTDTPPVDDEKGENSSREDKGEVPDFASGLRLVTLMTSLLLCQFLVALDMSIIATAIPKITSEFHSLDQVGWYGSGFLLTLASFVSLWGKAFRHANVKWAFLSAVAVFELGSLICGVAQNSTTLIVGRAIQGCGGAGMTSGVYLIVSISVTQRMVPALLGLLSGIFSVASVVGPLLGGAFTDRLTWRWCFFINLIVGAPSVLFLALFYTPPAHHKPEPIGWKEFAYTLDLPGVVVILGALTSFILALEYGGATRPWNSACRYGKATVVDKRGLLVDLNLIHFWERLFTSNFLVHPGIDRQDGNVMLRDLHVIPQDAVIVKITNGTSIRGGRALLIRI